MTKEERDAEQVLRVAGHIASALVARYSMVDLLESERAQKEIAAAAYTLALAVYHASYEELPPQ